MFHTPGMVREPPSPLFSLPAQKAGKYEPQRLRFTPTLHFSPSEMLESLQPLHIFLFHQDISKVGYLAMNQFQYSVLHCYTQQAVSRINFEEEAF